MRGAARPLLALIAVCAFLGGIALASGQVRPLTTCGTIQT